MNYGCDKRPSIEFIYPENGARIIGDTLLEFIISATNNDGQIFEILAYYDQNPLEIMNDENPRIFGLVLDQDDIGDHKLMAVAASGFLTAKEEINFSIIDRRDLFSGDWQFHVKRTWVDYDFSFNSDSVDYQGYVKYGPRIDEIVIQYTEKNSITATINRYGELSEIQDLAFSGGFIGLDSINLFVTTGGMGLAYNHWIDGRRLY